MNRSQTWTALSLALVACPALSACKQANDPSFVFDNSVQPPVAAGQGYSLVRSYASSLDEISHMAVSDDYLFFSINWEGLVRMPKYGGKAEWVDGDTQAVVGDIAADSGEVFWLRSTFGAGDAAHTKLERRLASGGPVGIMKDGGIGVVGIAPTHSLVVDATNLYSLDETLVWVFPLQGGAPSQVSFANIFPPLTTLPPGQAGPPDIPNWVPDYPAMYFSNCLLSQTCALWKADATDGSFTNLMPLQSGPGGDSVEAVDETFLYLIKGQHVVRMSKADLTISDVYVPAAGQTVSGPVLVDANNVYFITAEGASPVVRLVEVSKTGGQANPIGWGSQLQYGIWDLAQDPSSIFVLAGPSVASGDGNEILMFPKTPASADAGLPSADGGVSSADGG